MSESSTSKPIIGWREWIALPELGIEEIKPKIDTGARSSSLHAFNIETFTENGIEMVRFEVHPLQRNDKTIIQCTAPLLENRRITSSTGHRQMRPVILTDVKTRDLSWQIELTLANRDEMGFRMLLGREAVRGRFLVDPARSYLQGKRRPKKKKKKRKKSSPGESAMPQS